jgi:ribosomal protein S18 acetylase RimI-like enzyme
MNTQFAIRPLDIRRDLDELDELVAVAFADDATTLGNDFRAEIRMLKKVVPLVVFLQRVSESFRHNFDGFVIENQGHFVALVVTGRLRAKSKRWKIGNVATHPDYRRRGLARRLVDRAIEHAKAHGAEMCLLKVRAENAPQPYPRQITRTQIRTSYADQIETLKKYGFEEIKVAHRLGLKLEGQ